jgi:hypothetical protein
MKLNRVTDENCQLSHRIAEGELRWQKGEDDRAALEDQQDMLMGELRERERRNATLQNLAAETWAELVTAGEELERFGGAPRRDVEVPAVMGDAQVTALLAAVRDGTRALLTEVSGLGVEQAATWYLHEVTARLEGDHGRVLPPLAPDQLAREQVLVARSDALTAHQHLDEARRELETLRRERAEMRAELETLRRNRATEPPTAPTACEGRVPDEISACDCPYCRANYLTDPS